MYALSIRQPWAWCIVHSTKRVENRSWRPNAALVGQRIAIHAAAKLDEDAISPLLQAGENLPLRGHYDLGCVIGTAILDTVWSDCPPGQAAWWCGPVGLLFRDVQPCDAIPCRGALSLWRLPPDVEARVPQTTVVP